MSYIKKIVGKRIALAIMRVEDTEQYVTWMSQLDMTDNLGSSARIVTIEDERQWILSEANHYQFAIIRLEDECLLGNCGIHTINSISQCAEIGIFIGEEANRNQGYGQEALELLLRYAFDYLNLHNIMLKVFAFNERAIKCYKKIGFQEIGRRRQSYYTKGKFHDEVYMDILKEDWKKLQS